MENEAEVFLNSVPLFAGLMREEKTLVVQALQEETFDQGEWVIRQVLACPAAWRRWHEAAAGPQAGNRTLLHTNAFWAAGLTRTDRSNLDCILVAQRTAVGI